MSASNPEPDQPGRELKQPITPGPNAASERPFRRRRLQLSCGECRKKKLSCDRNWPCQRCVRAGRPNQCSFESGTGQPPVPNPQFQQAMRSNDEIQGLRDEITQLKGLLSKAQPQSEDRSTAIRAFTRPPGSDVASRSDEEDQRSTSAGTTASKSDLSDPQHRSPRGYYSRHTLFQFFIEVPQLFLLVKETVDEWLKPMGVDLKKNKPPTKDSSPGSCLDQSPFTHLFPSKEDTDTLVNYYLGHAEQIHRVVHIPIFKREYANFWNPGRARQPAMEALVLAMLSIAAFASVSSPSSDSTVTTPQTPDGRSIPPHYRTMPTQWIAACEDWLAQQKSKHRKLVHYQISVLVYFAKRMNMISKKTFWKETASLLQNAIIDGLHRDPCLDASSSPYMREMKRRIWAVLRELELQNTYEYGLPSLVHSIRSDVAPPSNVNDEEFDTAAQVVPKARPLDCFTSTSYQAVSSQNWALRLEISQKLYSPGLTAAGPEILPYDEVLRYTHLLTQAIQGLPKWGTNTPASITIKSEAGGPPRLAVLAHAFLEFQLKECLLAIHRAYLQESSQGGGEYWLSENVCWNVSREILLMSQMLAELGIQSLTLVREDLLLACLNLTRVTMLQPKGSQSIILTSSDSILDLLEQSLPSMRDRFLRSSYGEPWCFVTLCAALMLLRVFLARDTWDQAKASLAQRVLDLRYEQVGRRRQQQQKQQQQHGMAKQDQASQGAATISEGRQQQPHPQQGVMMPIGSGVTMDVVPQFDLPLTPAPSVFPASGWLDSSYPDLGVDPFELDMDLDALWDTTASPWWTVPGQAMVE